LIYETAGLFFVLHPVLLSTTEEPYMTKMTYQTWR